MTLGKKFMDDVMQVGQKQLVKCESCDADVENWHFLCPECGDIL